MKMIKLLILINLFIFTLNSEVIGQNCITVYDNQEIERVPVTDIEFFENSIYVSTYFGGFYKITNGIIDSIEHFNSPLADIGILGICQFNNKLALSYRVAGNISLHFYDLTTESFNEVITGPEIAQINQNPFIGPNFIYAIESINNTLLMGTSLGLFVMDSAGNQFLYEDLDSDGNKDYVTDIEKTESGELLLGTTSGCYNFNSDTYQFSKLAETEDYSISSLISLDNDKVLFISSNTRLLLEYDDGQVNLIQDISDLFSFLPNTSDMRWHNDSLYVAVGLNLYRYESGSSLQEVLTVEGPSTILVSDGNRLAMGTFDELVLYDCNGTMTDLFDEKIETEIKIYPNPSQNYLNINLSNMENINTNFKLTVINSFGEKMTNLYHTFDESNKLCSLDLSHVKSGLYYLCINSEHGNIIKKFIKIE
jgi:hypothetical protein